MLPGPYCVKSSRPDQFYPPAQPTPAYRLHFQSPGRSPGSPVAADLSSRTAPAMVTPPPAISNDAPPRPSALPAGPGTGSVRVTVLIESFRRPASAADV